LPLAVAEAAAAQGRAVHILTFKGNGTADFAGFPRTVVHWGEVGKIFNTLRAQHCREVVLAGSLSRPALWSLRPDIGLITNLPAILKLLRGGDDSVLKAVVRLFEAKGFRVAGAHEIAPHLVAPAGPIGEHTPAEQDHADIALGLKVVQALGALDIGQAAVVSRGYVLAVEAAEGTDEMLRRCRKLHQWGLARPSGVLVKCPKPGQELRVDMPAVGPETVKLAAEAGLRGIAVTAGKVLLLDPQAMIEEAGARGLFIAGTDFGG
jgi:DUF1009 family protein